MAIKTFTTGEVLTAADTNAYLANAGLVYVTDVSVGTGASVVVSNCFTSTFKAYRILGENLNSNVGANLRLSFSGYAGNEYYSAVSNLNVNGTPGTTLQNGTTAYFTMGYVDGGTGNSFGIDVHGPQTVTRTSYNGTGFGAGLSYFTGGQIVDTTASTGFTITLSTGTFVDGRLIVYGYRKA
jgi:hypothetical protein